MKKSKKSGFTLVELMVVAAIIAILAAIIIPLLTDNKQTAVEAEGKNIAGAVMNAAKSYYARTGTWSSDLPTIDSELADDVGDWAVVVQGSASAPEVEVETTANNGFSGTLTLDGDGDWTGSLTKD